ncbi:putative conserved leucine-rich repeat protein [Rosellinia necatrix]|uniref:Putative conserved leucine-rich repeat protein n=1 Tax=Rosellinia necatrix TaxID=77044 RepID=A0A1W2TUF1_ROSNE|nr:putative conserved leucine-rich repeat protein [Rosellinia necatrix]
MDEKRAASAVGAAVASRTPSTGRAASGIPKPSSRLPLPRSSIPTPTSTVRSQKKPPASPSETTRAPSTLSSTAGSLRGPRLRPTASREQINTSATLPRSYKSGIHTASPQSTTKGLPSRNGSLRLPQNQSTSDSPFKKPAVPRRRPSTKFGHGTQPTATSAESPPSDHATNDSPELPPLSEIAAANPTFDELLAEARKPGLSLTERTIETLSNLPSSPAGKRRGSTFFDVAGSKRPQSKGGVGSRPGSSCHSEASNGRSGGQLSRPGSSSSSLDKGHGNLRAPANSFKPPLTTVQGTPSKRMSALVSATPSTGAGPRLAQRTSLNNLSSRASLSASIGPRTPSPGRNPKASVSKLGSKTLAVRPMKTRGSIHGLFNKPSMPSLRDDQPTPDISPAPLRTRPQASAKSPGTSGESRNASSPSVASTAPTVHSLEEPVSSFRKSSSALRDQIAKAKAAKRAASRQVSSTAVPETPETLNSPVVPRDDTFDFGLSDDPFGQKQFEDSNRKVMQSRIDLARVTGRLNIAAMGLREIPDEVLKMYDLESIGGTGSAWAESVDLTRFVAADNELETIDESIFPDVDPNDFDPEEVDDKGRIFWGLESADLHNNSLISLPLGLRRLQQLTSLNLVSNKLTNNCLEVISQCVNLRDLKLGNNLLYGSIEEFLVLENLEILDLHGNNLSALPSGLDKMKRLRIINIDENAFETLPFHGLSALPLSELHVRKNKLAGTLIQSDIKSLPQLQTLDCSGNQLSYIVSPDAQEPLSLPSLHQLTVSANRLKSLPDMSTWSSILTINADDNNISTFPEGFTSCHTLRHAGFSGNDIRIIPPEIARMDELAMLSITGNPLRDKKFTSLTTEELKDALAARLEPLPGDEVGGVENFANGIDSIGANSTGDQATATSVAPIGSGDFEDGQSESDNFATPPTSAPHSPARSRSHTLSSQTWPVKSGGVLDRSNTQSSSLHPVVCSKIAAVQSVREVRLQHNTFTQFPNSLSFFSDTITSLCLSHNQLTGESWLTEQLDLTALQELNIRSNFCTSLTPLTTYLCAPNLEKLDVSLNRIVRLPALREFFPSLTVLLISNNRLEELDPDTIKGLKIVDASNNEIAHLNPRIGLLGLDRLDVMGNRFRVPRWNVLDRGTEATLRWLRGRVPVAEMAEWRARSGAPEDDSSSEVD